MVEEEIELVAMRSTLPGSGEVKLSDDIMERLGVSEGQDVEVSFGRRKFQAVVVQDYIYSDKGIRIRESDMKYLDLKPGKLVRVAIAGKDKSMSSPKESTSKKGSKSKKRKSRKKRAKSKKKSKK